MKNENGLIVYITGLSNSGKTTIAKELQKNIPHSVVLDGDEVRKGVNSDLGYDGESKKENIRRNNELIKLLYKQGFVVICAFRAGVPEERDKLFDSVLAGDVIKVQLSTSLSVCIKRDTKGLYVSNTNTVPGFNSKYVPIANPDLLIDTHELPVDECVNKILNHVASRYKAHGTH